MGINKKLFFLLIILINKHTSNTEKQPRNISRIIQNSYRMNNPPDHEEYSWEKEIERAQKEYEKNPEALHYAVKSKDLKKIRLLTILNEKINIEDKYGLTPLRTAVLLANPEATQILLCEGASVNINSKNGDTILHRAIIWGKLESSLILLERYNLVNAQNKNGQTPLHFAAIHNEIKIIHLLLSRNARIDIQDNEGKTPLHEAVHDGTAKTLQALLYNIQPISIISWNRTIEKQHEVLPLKYLCINHLIFKEYHPSTEELPSELRADLEDYKKLMYIRYLLTIKDNHKNTAFDIARNHFSNSVSVVKFVHHLLHASTLAELRQLGYTC